MQILKIISIRTTANIINFSLASLASLFGLDCYPLLFSLSYATQGFWSASYVWVDMVLPGGLEYLLLPLTVRVPLAGITISSDSSTRRLYPYFYSA